MFARILLTGITVATLALAQGGMGQSGDPSGMGSSMGGGGGRGGGAGSTDPNANMGATPRPQKETKADLMASRLKMNKDQKQEFVTLLESTQKDAQPTIQQVIQARQNLANGIIGGKTDAEIATLNQAVADAQFAMIGVEVKTFQKVLAMLKPNQTAKSGEAFDLMSEIFIPQPGMGGGGRGRGGR